MALEDVENAIQENQLVLAEKLLREAYEQSGGADIFYQVIRSGSVPVLKLLLKMNMCDDAETFLLCSNAMIELGVKNVPIGWEMSQHLLLRISSYGLHNLSGDSVINKPATYWKESISLISKWVRELRERAKWYDFLDVDDEVMFRISMIHNHLYFIKNHPALLQLPLKELIFCLAVYIHIFRGIPGSFAFSTVLNKRNVMQFLLAIVAQLERVKQQEEGKESGDEVNKKPIRMHILKKMLKTYRRAKHIYTTFKVIFCAQIYRQFNEKDYERANASLTVATMKRFIQIFGEAIKNTADSPNLSKKLHSTLYQMLSESFSLNSKYRNFSSHGFPLSYLFVRDTEQIFYYKNLPDYIFLIEVSMLILCVYTLHDCTRYLYGMMRRCRSIDDLRALVLYASGEEIADLQEFLFKRIWTFLNKVEADLKEADNSPLSEDERRDLSEAWENYNQKVNLVDELSKIKLRRPRSTIEIIAFANGTIQSIHRLLDAKFTDSLNSCDVYKKICYNWETLAPPSFLSKDYRGTIVQSYVHRRLELEHEYTEEWRYREKSREIFDFFMENSKLDGNTLRKLEDELHAVLCKSQNGYYLNIFDLNCKAHAISLTLKDAFTGPKKCKEFKQRKLEFKLKLAELRKQDETELREIFQTLIGNIRQSFLRYNCDTIDNFVENRNKIPLKVHLAIQYWQLQIMEILCGTGFFGDNFITLTKSLPMMWGSSYRNYLAHDSLSYHLLTSNEPVDSLVNGFVLAWDCDDVDIFGKSPKFKLERLVNIEHDGFRWIEMQRNLLSAIRKRDVSVMGNCLTQKAELTGNYLLHLGRFLGINEYPLPLIIAHEMLEASDRELILSVLQKWNPQMAFNVVVGKNDLAVALNLQRFDDLPIEEAFEQFETLQPQLVMPCVGALLCYFETLDDFPAMEKLLNKYDNDNNLVISMAIGGTESGRRFLEPFISYDYNMFNELQDSELNRIFTENYPATDYELGITVRSNDVTVFKHIIRDCYQTSRSTLTESDLLNALDDCFSFGRLEMIRFLLDNGIGNDPNILSESLYSAVVNHQWDALELLLENGVDAMSEDEAAVEFVISHKHFKLLRKMIGETIPKQCAKDVILRMMEKGTLRAVKFVLTKGVNIWQCEGVLSSALGNMDPEVFLLMKDLVFIQPLAKHNNAELTLWMRVLSELKILAFLANDSHFFPMLVGENSAIAMELLDHMSKFLAIDDWHCAMNFHFEDISGLLCTYIRTIEFDTKKVIEKCDEFMSMIRNLAGSLLTKTVELNVTFVDEVCVIDAEIKLTIYSTKPIAQFSDDPQVINMDYHLHTADTISLGLRGLLLKIRHLKAATGSIVCSSIIHSRPERFRYIQIEASSCILEESSEAELDLGFLMNFPGRQSVLHSIPAAVPEKLIQKLLRHGADPTCMDKRGRTPFRLLLAGYLPLEPFDLLYQYCVNNSKTILCGKHIFNLRDDDGYTPLHAAVGTNNYEIAKYQLLNGADPTVADSSGEAAVLGYAILNRNVNIVRLLLDHCPAMINMAVDKQGSSALRIAARINHDYLVRLLLERGANLFHVNNEGSSVLQHAIEQCAIESLRVILDFADGNGMCVTEAVNMDGISALQLAEKKSCPEVLELLVCHIMKATGASLIALMKRHRL